MFTTFTVSSYIVVFLGASTLILPNLWFTIGVTITIELLKLIGGKGKKKKIKGERNGERKGERERQRERRRENIRQYNTIRCIFFISLFYLQIWNTLR